MHVACIRREDVQSGFFWGKPEGRRPLERPMYRWEDNIKMTIRAGLGGGWVGDGLDLSGSG
jgi:hypothetical protein